MRKWKFTESFTGYVAALASIVVLLAVALPMIIIQGNKYAASQAITGAWYTKNVSESDDGDKITTEYYLKIDRSGKWREIRFNDGITVTERGRWRLNEDKLDLFNEPESESYWRELLGFEEKPTKWTKWKVVSASPRQLILEGYGVTLHFVKHTVQREDDIRSIKETLEYLEHRQDGR